jgi:hypothetical protein
MASTLTDILRGQSDEALAALVRARPDLIVPVPADIAALATRAQSRISVARVVDRLTRFQLEILDALRLTRGPDGLTSLDDVLAIAAVPPAGADAVPVRATVRELRSYLLAFGRDDALQVVAAVDDVLGPYPAGLGRPAAELDPGAAELAADPARLRRTLLSAPPAARAVLDRLAAGPPVGTTSGEPAENGGGETPVAWLVDRGLLVTAPEAGAGVMVELPREVALVLRRDAGPLGALHPSPPLPEKPPIDPDRADQAGVGQALDAVRLTSALLEALAAEPAPVLRSGGMGIRELRRLARTAGLEEPVAALLTEVGYAAGLLGEAEPPRGASVEGTFRPTANYDVWSGAPLAVRWHALATAWLAMARQPGVVGQMAGGTSGGRYRDRADRLIAALAPEAGRAGAPGTRRTVLGVLSELPPGTAATIDEVLALVGWYAPRRAGGVDVRQVLTEAATLGITGLSALTSYGAALLDEARGARNEPDDDPLGIQAGDTPAGLTRAAARLDALLPSPVDEVVVQADLTVIVPGPPEPALAAELELIAEHESAGGASVYRVSRDSLRRALDAGYAAEDLHALFARRSRTAIPQGLRYLIDDVARAHGGLRVGSAHAYLRSDDEALVAQALADRRLAPLGLRRLAPTVLASAASTGRLLAALRDAGYVPVPEDASGAAVLVRPRTRRAPARPPVTAPPDPFAATRMSRPRLLGIIEDIRRGDAAVRAARRAPATIRANGTAVTAQAHTEALAVLQQAVRDKALVWVRYVDAHGSSTSRLVRPVSIGAGYLRAEDERTDTLHTFALHRITAATLDA